ncbi:MAG: hypothetical protein Q8L48_21580 [Archangium sp.]|nr:hypothetical protein [Archangium sp.]
MPIQQEGCDAVERIVAALITSWARQLPSIDSAETLPPPPARPVVVIAPEPEALPEPAAPPLPEPEPLFLPPSSVDSPRPPRNEVSKPVEQAPKSAGSAFTLDLAALGGASVGPTPAVSGLGQLQVGLGFGRLGALLEGGLESGRAGDLGGARVETTSQWVSLSARVRFEPLDRLHFDLALGFRLWRIAALGLGLNGTRSLELAGLGGVLSAGASLRLAGPLFAHLRAFASLRSQGDRFLFEGLGPVLDLRPLTGGLLLGLEVRAFGG